jgi:heat shock protein HslJ
VSRVTPRLVSSTTSAAVAVLLALAFAGCASTGKSTSWDTATGVAHPLAGEWRAEMPAASSPGRTITLNLRADFTATFTQDYRNGDAPIVEQGSWKPFGSLEAEIIVRRGGASGAPTTMRFRRNGEVLRAIEYDRTAWGEAGLALARVGGGAGAGGGMAGGAGGPGGATMELGGTLWQWAEFVSPVERLTIDDPSRYTIEFGPDGRVACRVDCNRANGPYKVVGREISVNLLAMTRAFCGPTSHGDKYASYLSRVTTWFVRDGQLYMEMPVDSGTLRFTRVR